MSQLQEINRPDHYEFLIAVVVAPTKDKNNSKAILRVIHHVMCVFLSPISWLIYREALLFNDRIFVLFIYNLLRTTRCIMLELYIRENVTGLLNVDILTSDDICSR